MLAGGRAREGERVPTPPRARVQIRMPRQARLVIPGCAHHVTQRGVRRQRTFLSDRDYDAYLRLAAEAFRNEDVEVLAYCLMPNHVHLILAPPTETALTNAVSAVHQRYTWRFNHREGCTGSLWQGRFSSFPMDEAHAWTCLRYVGLNPVRAGLADSAFDWRWSSAQALVQAGSDPLLPSAERRRFGRLDAGFFEEDIPLQDANRFRQAAKSGEPVGAREWLKALPGRRVTA
jgi:putative transposase